MNDLITIVLTEIGMITIAFLYTLLLDSIMRNLDNEDLPDIAAYATIIKAFIILNLCYWLI